MTQYVGCDQARTLLEGLIDGELSMVDQLAVESHLRWCDTCALRVADMRVIGRKLLCDERGVGSAPRCARNQSPGRSARLTTAR